MEPYLQRNQDIIEDWVQDLDLWGPIIAPEEFAQAKLGLGRLLLTPTRLVPKAWLGDLEGKQVLGLGAGGGTQMPVLAAQGASCSLIDLSPSQLEADRQVAIREGYSIALHLGALEEGFPFENGQFDVVILPSTLVYVRQVSGVFQEIHRVLKPGGVLLAGFANEINFFTDIQQESLQWSMPFDPVSNEEQANFMIENQAPFQFSHSLEDQVGGLLKQGFMIQDLYEDTNGQDRLHDLNIQTFYAIKARKPEGREDASSI